MDVTSLAGSLEFGSCDWASRCLCYLQCLGHLVHAHFIHSRRSQDSVAQTSLLNRFHYFDDSFAINPTSIVTGRCMSESGNPVSELPNPNIPSPRYICIQILRLVHSEPPLSAVNPTIMIHGVRSSLRIEWGVDMWH